MAKREFISREEALSHPFANGKYDHKNADINFILGHESYKEWLETFPVFTEQEIVKPYFEKLTTKIQQLRGCSCSNSDGVIDDIEDIIDNLLSEQEVQEDGK
jgi:hypothetical protein